MKIIYDVITCLKIKILRFLCKYRNFMTQIILLSSGKWNGVHAFILLTETLTFYYTESRTYTSLISLETDGEYLHFSIYSWHTKDVLIKRSTEKDPHLYDILVGLKPWTQYAVYVETYTTALAKQGARSKLVYFRTAATSIYLFIFFFVQALVKI